MKNKAVITLVSKITKRKVYLGTKKLYFSHIKNPANGPSAMF